MPTPKPTLALELNPTLVIELVAETFGALVATGECGRELVANSKEELAAMGIDKELVLDDKGVVNEFVELDKRVLLLGGLATTTPSSSRNFPSLSRQQFGVSLQQKLPSAQTLTLGRNPVVSSKWLMSISSR
ncbi:hypothetical protein PVAG01_07947 [Phlyctema vagabunda]|uniref:Uncharacterized protein n=1 Tax=Phlyctema vagabunda TaxID=108571 RepID=A0ABR4PDY5_9HELO